MSPTSFAVLFSHAPESIFAPQTANSPACLLVDQSAFGAGIRSEMILSSPSTDTRSVAIVDRTVADIDAAARATVVARFSFCGRSPYAPDLILVNEFVKEEFLEACIRHSTAIFARSHDHNSLRKLGKSRGGEETRSLLSEAEKNGVARGFGGDLETQGFRVIEILNKSKAETMGLLGKVKIGGRYLLVASVSSLVDALFNYDLG